MILVSKLVKHFGQNRVLDNLDLEVKSGETMVIIGRSGCGKTVLLKHIIGLLKPDSGRIWVDGLEITSLKERELNKIRRKFGMLFQSSALFDSLTVEENVAFGLREHTNLDEESVKGIVREKLKLVGLEGAENLRPQELSGGMKKRVGLARALALDPQIILYDEPTSGLDPIMADEINRLIVDLRNRLAITALAVTHDMTSAYKIADRIAMLYQGRIIEIGSPEEIRATKNSIVKQFITGEAEGPITKKKEGEAIV